jgi:uncharacterized membrane protein
MKTENKVLMAQAREALEGKWGLAVGGGLVFILVNSATSIIPFASIIIGGPMYVGLAFFFLSLSRKQNPTIKDLFSGFNNFLTALVAFLLVGLYTILWMLLLIIPGIMAAISYSQTFLLLADNPSMSASEAIEKSKKMMDGNKLNFFYLGLRFIGWSLLCVLTFGIGFLWLIPYMQVTFAKFHDDIKNGTIEQPVVQSQNQEAVPQTV